jgi:hypothetical protein
VELPFNSQDVTTVMRLMDDIQRDVELIRRLLSDEDDDEEEASENDG